MSTAPGLSFAIERGARLRRGRFSRRFALIALPTAAIAIFNLLLYFALANRHGSLDVRAAAPALTAMFIAPIAVGIAIAGLSRDRFPLSAVVLWSAAVFIGATAALSAARLQLSYSSIVACCVITTIALGSIAARLWAAWEERVAILGFDGASAIQRQIGGEVEIIGAPSATLGEPDVVLIDVRSHHGSAWADVLARAYRRGVPLIPWTKYLESRFGRTDVETFDVSEVVYSTGQAAYASAKHLIDWVVVIALAPVWVPILTLISAYVLAVAGRPVIFRQIRRGYGDEDFTLYKFRTMAAGSDHAPVAVPDTRVIAALAWLRRTRLDELPQLINVLEGKMSLVGPRPEALEIARRYEATVSKYVDRRLVRPGVTGWAQVNVRASSSVDEALEKLAFDLYYVKHLSPDLDLLILAKTVKALFALAPAG